MGYIKRTDRNHAEIRDAIRAKMYPVLDLSGCGKGIPDLAVLICPKRKISLFLEVKDGKKPPSARKTTAAEDKFIEYFAWNTKVVTDVDSAMQSINDFKREIRGLTPRQADSGV